MAATAVAVVTGARGGAEHHAAADAPRDAVLPARALPPAGRDQAHLLLQVPLLVLREGRDTSRCLSLLSADFVPSHPVVNTSACVCVR